MKPTNEERREVAERLHYVAEHGAPEWSTAASCIAECIGEYDYPLWEGCDPLFSKLADLIEPEPELTCRDDGVDAFRCTRCGAFVKRGAVTNCCAAIPIRFCPNCGAKVVE